MTLLTVKRPDMAQVAALPLLRPPPLPRRSGLRLTLVENGKPKAKLLMQEIAHAMAGDLSDLRIETVSKASASWPVEPKQAAEIAARSDLILTGLGDCGGCSANSVADAIQFEHLGTRATTLITEPFAALVAAYAMRLGAPGYPCAILPHPVSSRRETELCALAVKSAPQVIRLLVADETG